MSEYMMISLRDNSILKDPTDTKALEEHIKEFTQQRWILEQIETSRTKYDFGNEKKEAHWLIFKKENPFFDTEQE